MIHPGNISIEDFTYSLPADRIAVYPADQRDGSRLLVYKDNVISDGLFAELDNYLEEGSLLIFNNTRVIRARLKFIHNGNPIEIFCLEKDKNNLNENGKERWKCIVGNLRHWKNGTLRIEKNNNYLNAILVEKQSTHVLIDFTWHPTLLSFTQVLESLGEMPIPPYLDRESEELDITRYQTIFASKEGSVAAPTASLHFTNNTLKKLAEKNIECGEVTLHVGAGTFKPVKSSTMNGHEMHAEWIQVSLSVIKKIKEHKGKRIAVGTTSLRTLESIYWMGVKATKNPGITVEEIEIDQWEVYSLRKDVDLMRSLTNLQNWMENKNLPEIVCQTKILIAPPYELKVADGLITNFHQPQSTLLLLVSAIVGEKWKNIYDHALKNNYRFLSYGDSSLLLK